MLHEILSSINIRNLGADKTFVPDTTIDVLFDYPTWLRKGSQITVKPDSLKGKKIAVIGAGASGLISALELLRCGAEVHIYEASDRIGGRMYSTYPDGQPGDIKTDRNVFELGCMRFPLSSVTFNYYMEQMGVPIGGDFPDPGTYGVDAQLYYQNKLIEWQGPENPGERSVPDDPVFQKLGRTFPLMMNYLLGDPDKANQPPKSGDGALFHFWFQYQSGDQSAKPKLMGEWQNILKKYWNTTFEDMIWELSQNKNIVGNEIWTTDDMNAFGALGMGSGGFGPLFPIGAVDMLRLIANGLEYKQRPVPSGISTFTQKLKDTIETDFKYTSKIFLNKQIEFTPSYLGDSDLGDSDEEPYTPAQNSNISYLQFRMRGLNWLISSPGSTSYAYDGVILATTTRAMEITGVNTALFGDWAPPAPVKRYPYLNQSSKTAIRNLHLTSSSKFFIETKSAFWEEKDGDGNLIWPSNIQSDELFRGLYCLKYLKTDKEKAIILVSYTWEDDSTKLLALSKDEKFEAFMVALTAANKSFADKLRSERVTCDVRDTVEWQLEAGYFGGFKLDYPGQDAECKDVFLQYRNRNRGGAKSLVLAGDSVSWMGGWIEGAITSGINAACGIIASIGRIDVLRPQSPLDTNEVVTGDYQYQPPFK